MSQPGMLVVDVQRCIACNRCMIYCSVAHSESGDLEGAMAEEAKSPPRVQVKELGAFSAPYQCRHCDDPPCVESCPTDSLLKGDDARVLLDLEKCTGQGKCVKRCPFVGIELDGAPQAVKCDFCITRIARGEEPACAEACPTDAIIYKPYDQLTDEELALRSGSPGAALVRRTGVRYLIDPDKCIGCTLCAKLCPAEAVVGERKEPHRIIQERCVTCGGCFIKCPKDAIDALAPDDFAAAEAALAERAPAEEAPAEEALAPEAPAEEAASEPPPVEEAAPEPSPAEEPPPEEAPQAAPPAPAAPTGPSKKELRRRERKAKRKTKRGKGTQNT